MCPSIVGMDVPGLFQGVLSANFFRAAFGSERELALPKSKKSRFDRHTILTLLSASLRGSDTRNAGNVKPYFALLISL